jgi:hypothetical protein
LSRPIIVRTRGESHQWDGITDPKRLQLPFATKSANSGHYAAEIRSVELIVQPSAKVAVGEMGVRGAARHIEGPIRERQQGPGAKINLFWSAFGTTRVIKLPV